MEEKKKRWRPTLTAYRELEKKLESQIDGTSQLVKDCDLWREKYQILKKKYDELSAGHDRLAEECKNLRAENDRLKSRGFIDRLLNR